MSIEEKMSRLKALYGAKKTPEKKSMPIPLPENKKPLKTATITGLPDTIFPYQKDGVAFLEAMGGKAILGDDMGLGKTCQALIYIDRHRDERPAFVLCPASLKLNWAKECFKWMGRCEDNRVYLLSGKLDGKMYEAYQLGSGRLHLEPVSSFPKTGIVIMNYDILANREEEFIKPDGTKGKKEIPDTGWIDRLIKTKYKIVITDEAHKYGSSKAARTKATLKLCRKVDKVIPISGTLILSRPMQLFNALNLVDPVQFPNAWKFGMRYCNPKNNGFGVEFKGASNVKELHQRLQSVMIRRMKDDVLKDLPRKVRSIVPMDIDNRREYSKAENDFITYLRSFSSDAALRAKNAEAITKLNYLKKLSIQGKMKSIIDWIEDFLEDNGKLVVFTTHKDTVTTLHQKFKKCSVVIDGSTSSKNKDEAEHKFQNNDNIQLLIGNIDSAGVGLNLTASNAVAILELPWTPGQCDQAEDRCRRIGSKGDRVDAFYLIANDTVEEDIAILIDEKRKTISAIMDGCDVEESSLISELFYRMKGGKPC